MIKMNKIMKIGIVGLGQVGIYLYNELNKKKDIEKKLEKKIKYLFRQKIKIKNVFQFQKIFYTNPFQILKMRN